MNYDDWLEWKREEAERPEEEEAAVSCEEYDFYFDR